MDKEGFFPNPYDPGLFTNFATVFEGEAWTFWLPTRHVPRFDGVKYPMVPPINDKQQK